MSDADQRMVLRTVFLPPDLDEELRVKAFQENVSKNDIIRQALVSALGIQALSQTVAKSKAVAKASATRKAKVGAAAAKHIRVKASSRRSSRSSKAARA